MRQPYHWNRQKKNTYVSRICQRLSLYLSVSWSHILRNKSGKPAVHLWVDEYHAIRAEEIVSKAKVAAAYGVLNIVPKRCFYILVSYFKNPSTRLHEEEEIVIAPLPLECIINQIIVNFWEDVDPSSEVNITSICNEPDSREISMDRHEQVKMLIKSRLNVTRRKMYRSPRITENTAKIYLDVRIFCDHVRRALRTKQCCKTLHLVGTCKSMSNTSGSILCRNQRKGLWKTRIQVDVRRETGRTSSDRAGAPGSFRLEERWINHHYRQSSKVERWKSVRIMSTITHGRVYWILSRLNCILNYWLE